MPKNFDYKAGYKPLKVLELHPEEITELPMDAGNHLRIEIQHRLHVVGLKAAAFSDQTITDAIVQEARMAGVTSMVLFDKDFVVAAIKEKMQREGLE